MSIVHGLGAVSFFELIIASGKTKLKQFGTAFPDPLLKINPLKSMQFIIYSNNPN